MTPHLPSAQPLATISLLSVSMGLPVLDISYKWNHIIHDLFCFLSVICSGFIHKVVCITTLTTDTFHSLDILLLPLHPTNTLDRSLWSWNWARLCGAFLATYPSCLLPLVYKKDLASWTFPTFQRVYLIREVRKCRNNNNSSQARQNYSSLTIKWNQRPLVPP